jgi:uncharacterized membrane protein (DUF4010 family)
MSEIELLPRAGLAVGIGLLIGIERGWQEREARDGARVAGIRTFTLIASLGGLCGLLSQVSAPVILGYCFLGFALCFGLFEWGKARITRTVSATDMVAGLLTFVLGAYAVGGNMAVAAAAGVATTAILAERRVLHTFLRHLKWIELRAALMLLIMTAVLLPALPDRPVDPWGALNPHQIWLMTVLIGAVCYAGYIAVQLAGERKGLLYAGLMGGLVTSTTVTWTFARLGRNDPASQPSILAAILAAWIVSLLRMTGIAIVIAPQLAAPLIPSIAVSALVILVPAALAYRTAARGPAHNLVLRDPFELSLMLRFTVLLAVIMLLAKLLSAVPGPSALFTLGGTSGLLDVDPITLSMAGLTRTGLSPSTAAATILIAAGTNGLAKAVLGFAFGGPRMGLVLGAVMAAAATAGALVYLR